MFEAQTGARVYGVALGEDFPKALIAGLRARLKDAPPEAMARAQIIVNTARMRRRLRQIFEDGPPCLLPKITLLTELGADLGAQDPQTSLEQRMELVPLVKKLLDADPRLAVKRSLYDLSTSLAALMSEMLDEDVPASAIAELDVTDTSGHWERAKSFIEIIAGFQAGGASDDRAPMGQRARFKALIARWASAPPRHPVILAGSTGSRGATSMLMRAVAHLEQGAVVVPGVDRHMPAQVWNSLLPRAKGDFGTEDHPQYRFADLCASLDLKPDTVPDWSASHALDRSGRAQTLSLALRPAPVTDGWLRDGPSLPVLTDAMAGVTLFEAQSSQAEASVIAARLKAAVQDGKTAALITPDRMLTRQVTAALERWSLKSDDSAGLPLHLTPPGRLLRQVADVLTQELTSVMMLSLLKHPLTHTGAPRNTHLRWTRELELWLRGRGPAFPSKQALLTWASSFKDADARGDWAEWLCQTMMDKRIAAECAPTEIAQTHRALAEAICAGTGQSGSGALWQEAAGREAQAAVDRLAHALQGVPEMTVRDYNDLFGGVLSEGEVRDRDAGHPHVLIWGTLEARVQGADLLILAGLNEGSWPEAPAPDPWLNRKMRHQAGLLLPERRIGLSAHDFEQAFLAQEVWVTRATRSDDAQTVPSRWLNRLTNLLSGLPDRSGPTALSEMRRRAQPWVDIAALLEMPIEAPLAKRPAPCPPVETRPRKLSVTEIKTLYRDPYAIYARHILRLDPLESLTKEPDPRLRGIVLHSVFEAFIKDKSGALTEDRLLQTAREIFETDVDWPSARALWLARLARIAPDFLEHEAARQDQATPRHFEIKGGLDVAEPGFRLTGQADRIDIDARGGALLYDYKTGHVPSKDEQIYFDMQLMFLAYMALNGAFESVLPRHIAQAVYLGVGTKVSDVPAPLEQKNPDAAWAELCELMSIYLTPEKGFSARRAMQKSTHQGPYDQLARFGEWDDTQDSHPEVLS